MPAHRFQVRADHMLAWLATAVDPASLPFQETYGFDETFRPGGDDLHDRIQSLVNQAQSEGVLTVPGHHLELWQVGGEGCLLTLDPPDGPRLCSQHLSIADLIPAKTAGSVTEFAILDATARVANELLDEHDHAVRSRTPGPDQPATPAQSRAAGAFPQPGTSPLPPAPQGHAAPGAAASVRRR